MWQEIVFVKSGALVVVLCSKNRQTKTVNSVVPAARARVRAEVTQELLAIARRQLAKDGSSELSLRAVAREAGLVSSAIYRYFPSRDDLLTALIVQGYEDLATAIETAEAAVKRADLLGRWRSASRAIRTWAIANPHDYALLYGTPVPGYKAPPDTIAPVVRSSQVFLRILEEGQANDRLPKPKALPANVRAAVALDESGTLNIAGSHLANGILAWSAIFGLVSFELFGHFHNVIHDYEAYFNFEIDRLAEAVVGIAK